MELLLISNSASPGEKYLEKASADLAQHLGERGKSPIFIPFAAVTYSFDEYVDKVNAALKDYDICVRGIHREADPIAAISRAEAILIGGGNTFQLVKMMQEQGLIQAIRERVLHGNIPYAGWSAGSNVACPTLCTTNDMPIVEPLSFEGLNFVPYQINPHYLDTHPEGHGGETREQRILEYIAANHDRYVVGLREGCRLLVDETGSHLIGEKPARIFKYGEPIREVQPGESLDFLYQ